MNFKKDPRQALRKIIFGLGSNLGDKQHYLSQAVIELEKQLLLTDLKKSKILKNPALLLANSPPHWNQEFFNIAVSALIDLEKFAPEKILETVKEIEKKLGRQERERWAPREIDIDILAIENLAVNLGDKLIIPHRELQNRDFFLTTIKKIEPNFEHVFKIQKISQNH